MIWRLSTASCQLDDVSSAVLGDSFRKVVLVFDRFVVSSGNNVEEASSVSRETSGDVSHPDPRHLVLRVTAYEHNEYHKYPQLAHIAICFPAVQPPFFTLKAPGRSRSLPPHVATSSDRMNMATQESKKQNL